MLDFRADGWDLGPVRASVTLPHPPRRWGREGALKFYYDRLPAELQEVVSLDRAMLK